MAYDNKAIKTKNLLFDILQIIAIVAGLGLGIYFLTIINAAQWYEQAIYWVVIGIVTIAGIVWSISVLKHSSNSVVLIISIILIAAWILGPTITTLNLIF